MSMAATATTNTSIPTSISSLSEAVDGDAAALIALYEAAREQAHTRLSAPQLQALLVIERDEGLNLGVFADGLAMLLSSASRLCDRLTAAGMLDREPSPVDRREISLRLTPRGRALLRDLRTERQRRIGEVLAAMAPAGRDALLRGLREFSRAAQREGALGLSA